MFDPHTCRIAHDLFLELDKDESGTVCYAEVVKMIEGRNLSCGKKCKQFLASVAFERSYGSEKIQEIDTSSWDLKVDTEEQLRRKLQQHLLQSSTRISDLFSLLSCHHTLVLTKSVFVSRFNAIGVSAPDSMLEQLFVAMDRDNSAFVGLEEIYKWMNGSMMRAQKSRELTFDHRDPLDPPLRSIDWEQGGPERLRKELQRLLIRTELCPIDLLRGYDRDGSGTFKRSEVSYPAVSSTGSLSILQRAQPYLVRVRSPSLVAIDP